MTAPEAALAAPAGADSGLHEKLRQVVRPEFAQDVILVKTGDAVLGHRACLVDGCGRGGAHRRLCPAHYSRWIMLPLEGRPTPEVFARVTPPLTRGRKVIPSCDVDGCNRGRSAHQLCPAHLSHWNSARRPSLEPWIAMQPSVGHDNRGPCEVRGCAVNAESDSPPLCLAHRARWRANGRQPIDEFVRHCVGYGEAKFDLRALPPTVRLEIQYAIQCRVDERRTKAQSIMVKPTMRAIVRSGVKTLLAPALLAGTNQLGTASFVRYAIERLRDLDEGVGWDNEFSRDIWRLDRVMQRKRCSHATIRFTDITQPWLRDATKRWCRWRLSIGISTSTVAHALGAVRRLSDVLRREGGDSSASALNRPAIEAWLAHISPLGRSTRSSLVSAMCTFLQDTRQHDWLPDLPPEAQVFRTDYPRREVAAPRFISEHLMAQIEDPSALARFPDPVMGLVTRILLATGLRIGDALSLSVNCVVRNTNDAIYLRYTNNKMAREAFVPISAELADAIEAHAQVVVEILPSPTLFPRRKASPEPSRV